MNLNRAAGGDFARIPIREAAETPAPIAGKVSCSLAEELSDQRSNDVTFRFTLTNDTKVPIAMFTPIVRVSNDVQVKEVTSSAAAATEKRRQELAEELTDLLQRVMFVRTATFRESWAQAMSTATQKVFDELRGGNLYLNSVVFLGRLVVRRGWMLDTLQKEVNALRYRITTAGEALRALTRFFDQQSDAATRELFAAKTEQLVRLEEEVQLGPGARAIMAVIEPGGTFAYTYVLRFPRRWFEPRKDQISIEVEYLVEGAARQRVGATQSLLITPHPVPLTAAAILGSGGGVVLKAFLPSLKPNASPATMRRLFNDPWAGGWFIVAAIIAVVVFNVYEHTKLSTSFASLRISWRSAILIGVLCGLANDRVLAALQALVG
jgi:hypothetical protein